jgi:hypothetical protein
MGTALSTTGNKHRTPCLIGVAISPLDPSLRVRLCARALGLWLMWLWPFWLWRNWPCARDAAGGRSRPTLCAPRPTFFVERIFHRATNAAGNLRHEKRQPFLLQSPSEVYRWVMFISIVTGGERSRPLGLLGGSHGLWDRFSSVA